MAEPAKQDITKEKVTDFLSNMPVIELTALNQGFWRINGGSQPPRRLPPPQLPGPQRRPRRKKQSLM